MSKKYNMIRLVNNKIAKYKLAKLHLKLSGEGESIKLAAPQPYCEEKNECR